MSPRNWADCPACRAARIADQEATLNIAKATYGKVSQDEYADNMEVAQRPTCSDEPALGEEYTIGVRENGMFRVEYSCCCNNCGFSHRFEHEEVTEMKAEIGKGKP